MLKHSKDKVEIEPTETFLSIDTLQVPFKEVKVLLLTFHVMYLHKMNTTACLYYTLMHINMCLYKHNIYYEYVNWLSFLEFAMKKKRIRFLIHTYVSSWLIGKE